MVDEDLQSFLGRTSETPRAHSGPVNICPTWEPIKLRIYNIEDLEHIKTSKAKLRSYRKPS